MGVGFSKLANAPKLAQVELIDFRVLPGFREGLRPVKNIQKMLLIPQYKVSGDFYLSSPIMANEMTIIE